MTDHNHPATPPDGFEGLLAKFSSRSLARNGVPDASTASDRERCHRLLVEHLGADLTRLHHSPLGPAWTDVFDAYPHRPIAQQRLARLGWLPLDRLGPPARKGSRAAATRWAVTDGGRVLAAVALHPADAVHDPVAAVIARCREIGTVRLREVLELRKLRHLAAAFPPNADALRVAAEIESGLDGRELAPWASGQLAFAPARLPGHRPARRLVVAISGVDGSGKTTLRSAVIESLQRCGVPVSTVWVRPGMGIGWLTTVAARVKRLLAQDAAPGIRSVAAGDETLLRSRTGLVGWIWLLLVVLSFLRGVWRQHRSATGVVVYDRHVVDALATVDFGYAGVNLWLSHLLIRRLLPRAEITIYLEVPTEIAVARKPDDLLGETAVRLQLGAYQAWLRSLARTVRLDATRTPEDLLATVLAVLAYGRQDPDPTPQL